MAHEITRRDNIVFARRPAWHGLGTVTEEAPTIQGALQLAGLDWEVEAWPLSATDGEQRRTVDSHVLNVRADTKGPLGVVGTGYVPLQNTELAGFAEELMGVGAKVESAGSIRGGKRVWFLIRTEEVVELGRGGEDRVVPYVLLANGHDGTLSFTVQPTTVRVVCSNTLHMSLRGSKEAAEAGRSLRLRHTSGMSWRVDDAKRVLEAHGIVVAAWRERARVLTAKSMSGREAAEYMEAVYDAAFVAPKSDRGKTRRTKVLSAWRAGLHDPKNTMAGLGGTAWSALNAVTDWADHQMGSDRQTRDDRLYRAWFGTGAALKEKAWELALAAG